MNKPSNATTHTYTRLHTSTHIYTHIHTLTHIHTISHTYTHLYTPTHTYTHLHTSTHLHASTPTYNFTHLHTPSYSYIHLHTLIHTFTHTFTHVHTPTHTFTHLHTLSSLTSLATIWSGRPSLSFNSTQGFLWTLQCSGSGLRHQLRQINNGVNTQAQIESLKWELSAINSKSQVKCLISVTIEFKVYMQALRGKTNG